MWTRSNVREVLPDLPCPQTLDLIVRLVNQAMREYFGPLFAPEAQLGPVIGAIGGRAWFNLSQLRHLANACLVPPATFLRSLGHSGELAPGDDRVRIPPALDLARNLRALGRIVIDQATLGPTLRRLFREGKRSLDAFHALDAAALSDQQLLAIADEMYDNGRRLLNATYTCGTFLQWQQVLETLCRRVGFSGEVLLNAQLAVGEATVGAQQAFDLLRLAHVARGDAHVAAWFNARTDASRELATWREDLAGSRFERELVTFIARYGHRGPCEVDWSVPRYREDPTPVLAALWALVQAPQAPQPRHIERRLRDEAARVWRDFGRAVPWPWRLLALPFTRLVLWVLKRMYLLRERNKSEMVRFLEPLRTVGLVLARRFVERGWLDRESDWFLVTFAEARRLIEQPHATPLLRDEIARRRNEQAQLEELELPMVLTEDDLAAALAARPRQIAQPTTPRRLHGVCVSRGVARGEVVVIADPRDFGRMRVGAIIVAPATDPSWIPLFSQAAGLVVEIGGSLSHASTIAREYGLPALAGCRDATRLLRDGDRVVLDASAGFVELSGEDSPQASG